MSRVIVGHENDADITIYYQDFGTGQPVVLTHGWPLSSRAWELQVPVLLEAGYRVITFDRRGFGDSAQPSFGYDYDTFAADLETLMTELDLRDVILIGHSMAGGELARYVGNYGTGRLAKLVFASAVPPMLALTPDNPEGGVDPATIQALHDGPRYQRPGFLEGFIHQFFTVGGKDLVDAATHSYYLFIAALASPIGTVECTRAFLLTDFRDDLKKIDVPTLVIHGDSDLIVPFEISGRRTHIAVEGSELVLLKDAPHGAPVTHAAEWNAAVLAFLAK
jgi:pimeloyl-ACP methyl ester carboxylesterase